MVQNIITGDKIQQLCDIYLGYDDDFNYNPIIKKDVNKHVNINNINNIFNNPYLIFCYSYRITDFANKVHLFKNPFILVTHNSDENIILSEEVNEILNYNKLIKWYSQNICFEHNKLFLIPIGFANSMWKHGDFSIFNNLPLVLSKSKKIYFNFNISTNYNKRINCYNIFKNRLEWLETVQPSENLNRLKEYKFCICPAGNGVDTHRLWEALYLKVVPIVIDGEFTRILIKYNVPLLVLNNWDELDEDNLNYENYDFNNKTFLNLINYNFLKNEFKINISI